MAKTLLQGVNDVLKRLGVIKGNSGELSSLTDSQRQVLVDLAVNCWNEVVIELYEASDLSMPKEVGSTTITLATGDRNYTLPSDLVYIKWPLINASNGYLIQEYPGGWDQIQNDQLQPANFTGRPFYATIRPTDGLLYMDRIPTPADDGLQFTLEYDKSLIKTLASDTFAFNDDVYHILIPAVAEKIKMERDEQSDSRFVVSLKKYQHSLGIAAGMISLNKQRNNWLPIAYNVCSDPMEE